jgi:hypothetical protein
MKGLEAEGFVHLYGLAPILSALKASRRDFAPRKSLDDIVSSRFQRSAGTNVDADSDAFENDESKAKDTKPEAQYTPWLFLQDRSSSGESGRTGDKLAAAAEVKQRSQRQSSASGNDSENCSSAIISPIPLSRNYFPSSHHCTILFRALFCVVDLSSLNHYHGFRIQMALIHRHPIYGWCSTKWSILRI